MRLASHPLATFSDSSFGVKFEVKRKQKSRRKTAFLLCWQRTLQNGGLKISPGGLP